MPYEPKVYRKQGADELVVASGGKLNLESGAQVRHAGIVDVTAATLTVTGDTHDNKTITLNRAAGIAVTLPAASGSGISLHFIVGTTFTSDGTIKVADATDVMTGTALNAQDSADTAVMFETAADSDTITLDGSTTGGIKGDSIELKDIAANLWWVRVVGSATGTEATPFSATVS